MLRILPRRKREDERNVGIDLFEDLAAVFLAIDEAVAFLRIVGMRADDSVALVSYGGHKRGLHLLLFGPARLIGGQAQVAISDERNGSVCECGLVHLLEDFTFGRLYFT